MSDKETKAEPCEPVERPSEVRITNDEKVEVNQVVNKKLTAMSKETKARKKKKLQKPPKDEHTASTVSSMTNNQIFLVLGVVGVIIAGVSLYYQRKTVMKMFKKEKKREEKPAVHVPHDVREELPEDNTLIKW